MHNMLKNKQINIQCLDVCHWGGQLDKDAKVRSLELAHLEWARQLAY